MSDPTDLAFDDLLPDSNWQNANATGTPSFDDLIPQGTQPPIVNPPAQGSPQLTFLQKVLHGFGDAALGAKETSAYSGPIQDPFGIPSPFSQQIDPQQNMANGQSVSNDIASRENAWQALRKVTGNTGIEWDRMLGAAVPGGALAATVPELGAGVLPSIATGSLQGLAASLLQPVGDAKNYMSSKLKQMAFDTGLGGAKNGILGWFGNKGANAGPPQDEYRDAVNFLRDRDVVPTPGQSIGPNAAVREDMTSNLNWNVPGAQNRALETYNRAGVNEALAPLNATYTGPMGRQAYQRVGEIFDKAYDSIKDQISLPMSDNLRTNIGQIISDAATPDASIAKTTQNILDKALYSKIDQNGVLSGQAFKDAESDIGRYAMRYAGDGATATERGVGEALQGVQGALRDSLEQANPQVAAQLRSINRGYAIVSRLRDAVPVGNADGLFTPYQLASAVARGDRSAGGRSYTEGDALLQQFSDAGLRVLGNKFPNSGTAGRLLANDPLAWPGQIGASLALKPLYSGTGTRAFGAGVNALSQAPQALAPVARAGQTALPFMFPGLLQLLK